MIFILNKWFGRNCSWSRECFVFGLSSFFLGWLEGETTYGTLWQRFAGWRGGAVQWGGGSHLWHLFQRLPRRAHGWFSCHLVLKSQRNMWAVQPLIARGTGPVFLKDVLTLLRWQNPAKLTQHLHNLLRFILPSNGYFIQISAYLLSQHVIYKAYFSPLGM